jgi:hypothetical protein
MLLVRDVFWNKKVVEKHSLNSCLSLILFPQSVHQYDTTRVTRFTLTTLMACRRAFAWLLAPLLYYPVVVVSRKQGKKRSIPTERWSDRQSNTGSKPCTCTCSSSL